jgi:serine/threonine-protein kinase HipA
MQKAQVLYNGIPAGILEKKAPDKYFFRYTREYFIDSRKPAISLTFPKTQEEFESTNLFPFFYGLLAEGINKEIQCRLLRIDEDDDFTRLLKTAGTNTIGAITVKELNEDV